MGGYGSGERSSSKSVTSSYNWLDIRRWYRAGQMVEGSCFFWEAWHIEVVSSMRRDIPNVVRLYPRQEEPRQSELFRILVEWTPCTYGGNRPWFICPARGCYWRVAILYSADTIACRHCHDLTYASQQASGKDRALHRAQAMVQQQPGCRRGV
jgi:hypothetical protein